MRTPIIVVFVAVATIPTAAGVQINHGEGRDHTPSELAVVLIDFNDLAAMAMRLTGREVSFRDIRVDETETRGFWATGADGRARVFVLPAEGELVTVSPDELVNIRGDVRPLTPELATRLELDTRPPVFIYAYTVRPAVVSRR